MRQCISHPDCEAVKGTCTERKINSQVITNKRHIYKMWIEHYDPDQCSKNRRIWNACQNFRSTAFHPCMKVQKGYKISGLNSLAESIHWQIYSIYSLAPLLHFKSLKYSNRDLRITRPICVCLTDISAVLWYITHMYLVWWFYYLMVTTKASFSNLQGSLWSRHSGWHPSLVQGQCDLHQHSVHWEWWQNTFKQKNETLNTFRIPQKYSINKNK